MRRAPSCPAAEVHGGLILPSAVEKRGAFRRSLNLETKKQLTRIRSNAEEIQWPLKHEIQNFLRLVRRLIRLVLNRARARSPRRRISPLLWVDQSTTYCFALALSAKVCRTCRAGLSLW